MKLNPSNKVRLAIYIVFGIGSLVVSYLLKRGDISNDEVVLFTAISSFVFGLAGINVSEKKG